MIRSCRDTSLSFNLMQPIALLTGRRCQDFLKDHGRPLAAFSYSPRLFISFRSCPHSFLDGIAAATMGSVLNYLLLGLAVELDRYYLHSFEILLACVVVFPGIGNVGYTLLEYRLGHRNLFAATFENLRWVPFL